MIRLRFKAHETAKWFWRNANTASGRAFLVKVAAGSTGTMPKISGQELRSMPVPLPLIEEQRAISSVLDDMDAEIEVLEAKLAKAAQIKKGMTQALITGNVRLVE